MQKLVLYSALGLILFAACGKDKFQDKPTVEIKSVNPTQVSVLSGSYTEILLGFTDKQGDLDSVYLYKERLNSIQKPVQFPILPYRLPDFPEKSKGEIKLTILNTDLVASENPRNQPNAPNGKEPDTIIFKIIVKDRGGNVSDTVTTEQLVIERS
ncbi:MULTISPECIES: hypothetical protein [Niastella]|uniref:DUF4625 domain-containing protein n=1 Tax=Niastella soli TaxID=2821487 RepID=A0ABS3Z3J7_9BACT|nr:hypothetical protein [Niastella soli]MBO9203966.1 hypothetical protein [Niastella soli]